MPVTLYDTIAAFLNKEGGIIVLGVDDNGTVLGLSSQNIMKIKYDVVTALNNPDLLNPPFPLAINEVRYATENLL